MQRLLQQPIGRIDPIGQTDLQRLLGSDLAPGVDDVFRLLEPHDAGKSLGATGARNQTELDLGLAHPGVLGQEP